jgi:hypothetical protein
MVHGLPVIDHVGQFYDMCVITKHRRTPFRLKPSTTRRTR